METTDYKNKFKALFNKLFQEKFELSVMQTERLLEYLGENRDKSVAKILETPFFANLLLYALRNYEAASLSVKIFVTKLVSIVMSNEVLFNRFEQMKGFEQLTIQGDAAAPRACAELYLAFAMIAHYSGVKYVVENKIYDTFMTCNSFLKPPGLAARLYDYVSQFIWKLNEYEEEEALLEVLKYVVEPLNSFFLTTISATDTDAAYSTPSMLTSVHVLVCILGEVEHLVVPNNVVPMLMHTFAIESKLAAALESTRDPALASLLAEASLRYHFAASRQLAMLGPDSETLANLDFYTAFNKISCTLIQKRSHLIVIEFFSHCHVFWYRVEIVRGPIEFEKFGKKFVLQNQFLLMMLIPIFLKQRAKKIIFDPMMEDANEIFHSDLAKTVPHDMVSTAYEFRNLLNETMGNNITLACSLALRELLELKRQMSRGQACVVFQTLYYALSEFVLSDGDELVVLAGPPLSADDERFLTLILDGIAMLLDEHEINWHDSVEIVQLQAALMNLIKQNILPVKLLVQAVDLVTTSVRKLLSPELKLLMESVRGGSLREAAGAARALLARPEPAARVAGARLLLGFMDVAYVKFMSLRSLISSHGLLLAAAECALRDPHAQAQAATLRCLAAAARCENLWNELLGHCLNLYEQLVNIMQHSPDGEVRKEAANVLAHVYTNRKVTAAFTRRVSHAMAHAATEDPHWPVRLAALNYWKQFMSNIISDRGVIDGTFPSVTFCKEKKKIIVLNEKEIHKQLDNVMQQLSNTGCLGIMLKCLGPHNHKEVFEKTFEVTNSLIEALDRYKYNSNPSGEHTGTTIAPSTITMSPRTMNIPPRPISMPPIVLEMDQPTSRGIDSMQSDENDLLQDIIECLVSETSESSDSDCWTLSLIEVVHPHTFIEFFREVAKNRPTKDDLGTLIDEIVAL